VRPPQMPATIPHTRPRHFDCSFSDKLVPRSYEERDFPEARERLKTRSW